MNQRPASKKNSRLFQEYVGADVVRGFLPFLGGFQRRCWGTCLSDVFEDFSCVFNPWLSRVNRDPVGIQLGSCRDPAVNSMRIGIASDGFECVNFLKRSHFGISSKERIPDWGMTRAGQQKQISDWMTTGKRGISAGGSLVRGARLVPGSLISAAGSLEVAEGCATAGEM